jgi:thiamine-phosphate pyrophosphorylase
MFCFPGKVYAITDTRISGLSHAQQVARLIEGGARLIQLREKHLSPREFFKDAQQAMLIARPSQTQIIINDRVDIALALRADGVHLGQTDLPPEATRRLFGPSAIIGFSAHNISQVAAAAAMPIDYLAMGPVFTTSTKENPDPVTGVDGLRGARAAWPKIPMVAIGGITLDNVAEVFAAGVSAAAIVRAVLEKPLEISARMRAFTDRLEQR